MGLILVPVLISIGGAGDQRAVAASVAPTVPRVSAGSSAIPQQQGPTPQVHSSAASVPQPAAALPSVPAIEPAIDRQAATATRAPARDDEAAPSAVAEALVKAAATAFVRGDAAKARMLYLQALAREPERPDALRGLGLALNRMSRRAEAARAFESYLRLRPGADDASRIRELLGELQRPSGPVVSDAQQLEPPQPLAMSSEKDRLRRH